ncbi:hypothetical protein BH10BAC4_BH10BAC4_12230 [soil metagenome]
MFFNESQSVAIRHERRQHERDKKFVDDLVTAAKYLGPLAVHDIQQGIGFAMGPDSAHVSAGIYSGLENNEERTLFVTSLARARKIGPDRFSRVKSGYDTTIRGIEEFELGCKPDIED